MTEPRDRVSEPDEAVLLDVLEDGRVLLDAGGRTRPATLYGAVLTSERRDEILAAVGRVQTALRPGLRAVFEPADEGDHVRLTYLAWRDKSGDVWEEVAASLIDLGLARVWPDPFPERGAYLARERVARQRGMGIWSTGAP
jgi:hypothetical protein